jgi:predicted nucleic acid-binding protein
VRFLVDTNVISAMTKIHREAGVADWVVRNAVQSHLSVITLGEIARGIEAVRPGNPRKAQMLGDWLDDLRVLFAGRILDIDTSIALRWGTLGMARADEPVDMLIAATALEHDLTLVTRNLSDFRGIPGLRLENPFA